MSAHAVVVTEVTDGHAMTWTSARWESKTVVVMPTAQTPLALIIARAVMALQVTDGRAKT